MIAVCVPSRGRPDTFQRFLRSFEETTTGYSVVLLRNGVKDPLVEEYNRFERRCIRVVGPDDGFNTTWVGTAGYAPAQEDLYRRMPNYEAYLTIEDDCVLETVGFDRILLEALDEFPGRVGVLELKDLANTITVQCLSREWCKAVGHLCPPEAGEHAFYVTKELATRAGRYRKVDVEFTHLPLLRDYGYDGAERAGAMEQEDVVARFNAQRQAADAWLATNQLLI